MDEFFDREARQFLHHLEARMGIFISYETVIPLSGWKKLFKNDYQGIAEKLWTERRDQRIVQHQEHAKMVRILKRLMEK